jgi:GNAT superfamily N-acetyltransferase
MLVDLTAHLLEPDRIPDANRIYRELSFSPIEADRDRAFCMADGRGLAALGRLVQHPDGAWELGGIWTAERWRGRGLARRMVLRLLSEAPAACRLHCLAIAHLTGFYESFGFRRIRCGEPTPTSIAARAEHCRRLAEAGALHPSVLLVRPAMALGPG